MKKLFVNFLFLACALFVFSNLEAEHNNFPTDFETSYLGIVTNDFVDKKKKKRKKTNKTITAYEELSQKPAIFSDIDRDEEMVEEDLEDDVLDVISARPE